MAGFVRKRYRDLSYSYEWSNQIHPEIYWVKIPEAELTTPEGSVWTNELIRRHFFGLDGYYYLNYYAPENFEKSREDIPYREETIGIAPLPGEPSRVWAGDIPI